MPLRLNLIVPNKAVHVFVGLVVVVALVVGVYAYTFPPSFLGHGGDQIWINTLTGETDLQAAIDGGMFGDITAVLAGVGLLGGGASGDVTLNADTTYLQRRVSSSCVAGSSIRAISSTGTVTCETDDAGGTGDITGVAAGTGLTGGGVSGNVTLNADTTYLQRRVSSSCAVGSSIRAISSTGTVTCETDDAGGTGDITGVAAGNGLTGGGSSGSVTLAVNTGAVATTGLEIVSDQVRLMNDGCAAGEILKRNAANNGWQCVADNTGTGDITGVTAGTGLSGGGLSGNVTLNANTTYLQRRVSSSCGGNQAIRVINSNGTVSCVNLPSSALCTWGSKTYSTGYGCWNGASCNVSVPGSSCTCQANGTWDCSFHFAGHSCPQLCGT